jgi:uncharacterized SAM-binding protein YcdF (DUF218 family)
MRWVKRLIFLLVLLGVFGAAAGWWLIRDNAQKSDAIVVLDGGASDARYLKGLELLRAGYGKTLFLDARADVRQYGHTPAEHAAAYIKETAGDLGDRVRVCPTNENGTKFEIKYVAKCLDSVGARSVLIVTSDYHTRRALSTAKKLMPEYGWTVAAAYYDPEFNWKWWKQREWAKTFVGEWERLVWWEAVDRWKDGS